MFDRSFWAALALCFFGLVGVAILFTDDCEGSGGGGYSRSGSYRTGSGGGSSYGGYGK